jgi:hypothetical protein
MHHPKADVKRKEGGRCLPQIEGGYKTEKIHIAEYLNKKHKKDQFVNIIKSHDSNQPTRNSAAKIADELSQPNENNDMQQDGIQNTMSRLEESLKKNGKTK